LAKSAESLEKKRVEFLQSAKKRKRVRKNLKTKGIDRNTPKRAARIGISAPQLQMSFDLRI
jgi:hypothetical protein